MNVCSCLPLDFLRRVVFSTKNDTILFKLGRGSDYQSIFSADLSFGCFIYIGSGMAMRLTLLKRLTAGYMVTLVLVILLGIYVSFNLSRLSHLIRGTAFFNFSFNFYRLTHIIDPLTSACVIRSTKMSKRFLNRMRSASIDMQGDSGLKVDGLHMPMLTDRLYALTCRN